VRLVLGAAAGRARARPARRSELSDAAGCRGLRAVDAARSGSPFLVRGSRRALRRAPEPSFSGLGASNRPLASPSRRGQRVRWRFLHPHLLDWSCPRRRPERRSQPP
jgi:hypothetical protein